MTDLKLSIQGVQRAQYAALQVVRAVKPEGALGRAVKFLATGAHMRLVTLTHVDTGTLRASELIRMDNLLHYTVYNNPAARNPRPVKFCAGAARTHLANTTCPPTSNRSALARTGPNALRPRSTAAA